MRGNDTEKGEWMTMHVVGRTHHSLIFSQHFLEWLFFSKYGSHYNISSNTVVIESKKTGKRSARS
jgi:hypothetical protein